MTTLQKLLQTIERNSVSNQAVINNVSLFSKSWDKEEQIDKDDFRSKVLELFNDEIKTCREKMKSATCKHSENHYYRKIINLEKLKSKIKRL